MSYNQNKIDKGLDNMPYNKRFKVPEGALPFIKYYIQSMPYGGGVFLNSNYSEYYKCRMP